MNASSMESYVAIAAPTSGFVFGEIRFASETTDSWDNYQPVNDPASGQKLNPGKFASDAADGWEAYEPVNDPASGQKLNPGKFASESEDTWETYDPHGASAPTQAEVTGASATSSSREAADSPTGNAMFDSLWTQALQIAPLPLAVFGCGNAQLCCAMSKDGKKAIKITNTHGCKVLVSAKPDGGEAGGLNVCLVGGAVTPGLIAENGDIRFAIPVETNRLVDLVKRIEKWTVSFLILFGREKAGLSVQSAA